MTQRLTLVPGCPYPWPDVPPTSTIWDSDYGVNGPFLNLGGYAQGSLLDTWSDGSNLYTTPMPSMEVPLSGTPIGGMTYNGLAAAFDGNFAKSYAACSRSATETVGFGLNNAVGLALSTPAAPTRFVAWSPIDNAFDGADAGMFWEFVASNTNDISTATVLATGYAPPINPGAASLVGARFPNGVQYAYCWFVGYGTGTDHLFVMQLQVFAQLPFSARGIISVAGVPMNSGVLAASGNSGPVSLPLQSVAYRGTILIPDPGAMHSTMTYGRSRMQPISNFSGRKKVTVVAGNPDAPTTTGFTYIPSPLAVLDPQDYPAFYPVNGDSSISVTVVNGLAEDEIIANLSVAASQNGGISPIGPTAYVCGVSVKSFGDTTPYWFPSGTRGSQNFDSTGTDQGSFMSATCSFRDYGAFVLTPVEAIRGVTKGCFGEANMRFAVTVDI
jgi:hypothetical protein